MPTQKDCPLCGELMRLRATTRVVRIPGNPEAKTQVVQEWVCPECDYFEEAEEEGT